MPHILIVDDDESIRVVIRKGMELAGHTVAEAVDGDEGMSAFTHESPDLVITDIMMPGTYGLQLIRNLHRQAPDVPIIAITGYQPSRLSMAEDMGGRCHFSEAFLNG